MQAFRTTLRLQSAFATPLKGDTLFGQLCWTIRNRFGEPRLRELLEGYTQGQPFTVLSDAFPEGYLPLPKLPSELYRLPAEIDRKAVKKLSWLPETCVQETPLADWLCQADLVANHNSDRQVFSTLSEKHPQPHNSINRQTNTTGENGFAPYSVEQEWFIPNLSMTVYILLDKRIDASEFEQCLQDMGAVGYGKDASIGLGKFCVEAFAPYDLPAQANANACLTLAPCAPQRLGYDSQNSYYQLFTRFGRHGDIAVHQQGKPFKNPVLMAQTAGIFYTPPPKSGFIGQGIGGNATLSKSVPETVQQGYAPVIPVYMNTAKPNEQLVR